MYVQPVGSMRGNACAQVDLPAALLLINTHAQVVVDAHGQVYLQSVGSMQSNARAREDMQPEGSTPGNMHA